MRKLKPFNPPFGRVYANLLEWRGNPNLGDHSQLNPIEEHDPPDKTEMQG